MSIHVNHIRGTNAEVEAYTPQVAEIVYDTSKKEMSIGDNATPGGIRIAKKNLREILAPPQITAGTADYNPNGLKHAGVLILTSDAARDITGLVPATAAATTDGREITIYNAGAYTVTLKDESVASNAANRFDLAGVDLVLAPKTSASLRYRNQVARWELVAQTVGAAVGSGAVVARTLAASSQGFSMINGTIAASVAAGALTVAVKTLAGNDPSAADPVHVLFRNATLASGDYALLSLTAAAVLVISSGSSLGVTNGVPFTLRLVGVNDAGTFRLGLINLGREGAALPLLKPDQLVGSTAEGGAGAADSANVLYTSAAVVSKPFAMLASLDWSAGLAAAGTWDALPSQIQLFDKGQDLPGYGAPAIAKNRTGMFSGRLVESHAANAVTFAVKTLAGNDPSALDPVYFTFQDANGGMTVRTVTGALSLTISSGSVMGASNNVAFRLWVVAFDTGSAVALGAVNCVSGQNILGIVGGVPYSSTAEGGAAAADSAHVIYTTAAQASKPLCLVGYVDYDAGLAAAGTWAVSPSRIVLYKPGMPRPGEPTGNSVKTFLGTAATGTTQIPGDDSIPQNTEGDQYLSATISVLSPCNLIDYSVFLTCSLNAVSGVFGALFRDAAASALGSAWSSTAAAGSAVSLAIVSRVLAGAPGATTFKLRAGPPGSATLTVNGSAGSRLMGGSIPTYIDLQEIMG